MWHWARFAIDGYEVSTAGDKRFSALNARLSDGRTIEEAYQLDVKGYRAPGKTWRDGKGKPPLNGKTQQKLWEDYRALWMRWAFENPELMIDLRTKAQGKILTDRYSSRHLGNAAVSQARALASILNEIEEP